MAYQVFHLGDVVRVSEVRGVEGALLYRRADLCELINGLFAGEDIPLVIPPKFVYFSLPIELDEALVRPARTNAVHLAPTPVAQNGSIHKNKDVEYPGLSEDNVLRCDGISFGLACYSIWDEYSIEGKYTRQDGSLFQFKSDNPTKSIPHEPRDHDIAVAALQVLRNLTTPAPSAAMAEYLDELSVYVETG